MVGKQDKFSQLEQAKWLGEHIEYYMADSYFLSEESMKMLVDMKTYAGNLYTYPTEALKTYQSIKKHFNNNPYEYMSGFRKEEDKKLIFSERLDAYFLPWEKEEVIPASMLATVISPENMKERYKAFLEEKLNTYRKEHLESLAKEVQKAEAGLLQLVDVWASGKGGCKGNNLFGLFGIIVMWILYLGAVIPKMQLVLVNNRGDAVFIMAGIGIACMLCSFVWGIGIYNSCKLKNAQIKKNKMKEVVKFFEHFYRQQCNPYNIDYMINNEDYVLSESNVAWDDYYEVKEFVEKFENRDKKKLLLVNNKVLYAYIAVIVIQGCCCLNNVSAKSFYQADEKQETVVETSHEEKVESFEEVEESAIEECVFDEIGFIFYNSHERYLSRDEVMALRDSEEYDFKTLLGFARNEIYARKGYPFSEGGKYYTYYMQYEWYQNMEHGEVTDSMINDYERANIDLIVGIEKEEGYR